MAIKGNVGQVEKSSLIAYHVDNRHLNGAIVAMEDRTDCRVTSPERYEVEDEGDGHEDDDGEPGEERHREVERVLHLLPQRGHIPDGVLQPRSVVMCSKGVREVA